LGLSLGGPSKACFVATEVDNFDFRCNMDLFINLKEGLYKLIKVGKPSIRCVVDDQDCFLGVLVEVKFALD
jgi:hypothetical protein